MSHTVVVYHSGYGHTRKQAEAVHQGAAGVAEATAELLEISAEGELPASGWEKLEAADAIVFGSPTYMGGASWQFKRFADASSKPWHGGKWRNKIVAGFTNSASMNGDKLSTLHYQFTLAMQHGMVWVGTGMVPANTKAATRNDVNWLGSFAGAMAQSPADSSAEDGPPAGDLETARLFGARVAETALRWNR
ncbi:MAG: flavodoxin family protein [Sulfuritalea sp.]|nr:flavodoxin family protein [Sulfuritalea sp.]